MFADAMTFHDRLDAVAAWLATVSIQVLAVGLIVAMADRLTAGRLWPQLRASLWWLVVLMLLAPPIAHSPVSIWQWLDPVPPLRDTVFVAQPAETEDPGIWRHFYPDLYASKSSPVWRTAGQVLLVVWFGGFVVCTSVAMWRGMQLRRSRFAWPRQSPPQWFETLARNAAERMGLKSVPEVVLADGDVGPGVVGIWRPTVVLPARLIEQAGREQIEHVLLHEMAHVRRRDVLASRICLLAQLVYWFHPVVWMARAKLETLREICCDESVTHVLRGGAPAYRRTLLRLAESMAARTAPVGFIHTHSQIMARLTHLQRGGPRRPRVARAVAVLLLSGLAIFCAPRSVAKTRPADAAPLNWSELPGCLQLQYAVLRTMASEAERSSVD